MKNTKINSVICKTARITGRATRKTLKIALIVLAVMLGMGVVSVLGLGYVVAFR